jgi:TolA-binding protein
VRAAVQAHGTESKAAVATYEEVLRRYPDFAPAQKQLAAIYAEDSQQIDRAYDLAVKARASLPDDAGVSRTLAAISYKKKDFNYAVQLFGESARKTPLDAKSLFYLGMSHLQLKQKDESRKALEEALAAGLPEPLAKEAKQSITELERK